jgi:hypothetical protein
MLRDRFPSEDFLRTYPGPVAILLAGKDEIVPNQFGRRLFDDYKGRKKLWTSAEAGHNDLTEQPAQWWREVMEFWQGAGAVRP